VHNAKTTSNQDELIAAMDTPARKEREKALKLDIVLSPAIKSKPDKSSSRPTSPVTAEAIEKKLTAADVRKASLDTLKMKNITEKLAKIELAHQKKEELFAEKALKAKEVVEIKEKKIMTAEETRNAQLQERKDKVNDHMNKIAKAQKELDTQMEEARLATEAALNEKMEDATKRREEVVAKVVEVAKTADKISLVHTKKEETADEKSARVASELADKLQKAADLKMKQDAEMKEKLAEQSRKGEAVRKNKEKLVAEGGSQTSEAC